MAGKKPRTRSNPAVAADIVAVRRGPRGLEVLLIQRKNQPFKGRWALPGGFLDPGEDLPTAARRELREETSLRAKRLVEIGTFSDPKRDPRGRVISVAFLARVRGEARAGDDAADARWFPLSKLPRLAFDHGEILRRARRFLKL